MKDTFITRIFFTRKEDADFDIVCKTAIANNFKMFCINKKVYSTELVIMRRDKQYASMEEAVIFNLADLIVL